MEKKTEEEEEGAAPRERSEVCQSVSMGLALYCTIVLLLLSPMLLQGASQSFARMRKVK